MAGAATLALLVCAGVASAQTPARITPVSGNGQLICPSLSYCAGQPGFFQTMVAKVTDANGNPVSNATVNWAVTAGDYYIGVDFAGLRQKTTITDSNGITSNNYDIPFTNALTGTIGFAFAQTTVTASAGSASTNFYLTQGLPANPLLNGGSQVPPIGVEVVPPGADLYPGATFSGSIGTTANPPIKIRVFTYQLRDPVPNVAVTLVNDPGSQATITCAEQSGAGTNTVLTDATGVATCNPIFGGIAGTTGSAFVAVGGYDPTVSFGSASYFQLPGGEGRLIVRVTAATPGAIRIVSGNSQSAQSGQSLAAPLVVKLESTSGVGLGGSTINWTVSPSGAASLGSASTTTDANGQTSNTVRFSSGASGNVLVTAALANSNITPVTFNLTAIPNVTVTGLQIISGNNQSAIINTAFGAPLVVQLNATNGIASGIPVQFSITGPGTLSATSANTNNSGQAQVTVQATGQAGAVTVTASANGFNQTFNLTVAPPGPTLTPLAFMNAADFQRGALSPCSLATVIAPGLAPGLQGMVVANFVGPLPYVLANDKVTVGGSAAPIMSVGRNAGGAEQLTFQVPCDVTPGSSVPVTINVGVGSATINIPILAASPGIFQTVMSDGVTRAVMLRPDGSFVSPQNPARRGENLIAFATGLGVTNPLVTTNSVAAPSAIVAPQGSVIVGMAGGGVPLITSQLSYDMVGLWLVTFNVPVDVRTGSDVPFSISVIPPGSSTPISSAGVIVPVQ